MSSSKLGYTNSFGTILESLGAAARPAAASSPAAAAPPAAAPPASPPRAPPGRASPSYDSRAAAADGNDAVTRILGLLSNVGALTVSNLMEQTGLAWAAFSQTLEALRQAELVSMEPNPPKPEFVRLTDKGRMVSGVMPASVRR